MVLWLLEVRFKVNMVWFVSLKLVCVNVQVELMTWKVAITQALVGNRTYELGVQSRSFYHSAIEHYALNWDNRDNRVIQNIKLLQTIISNRLFHANIALTFWKFTSCMLQLFCGLWAWHVNVPYLSPVLCINLVKTQLNPPNRNV